MTQASAARTRCPAGLVTAIRRATACHADWPQTAVLVADQLRLHLPGPEMLTADEREGSPDGYVCHTLHAEPDGAFSVCGTRLGSSVRRTYDLPVLTPAR